MVVRGHIRNGRVELDEPIALPEGTIVEVSVPSDQADTQESDSGPTLYEQLAPLIGKLEGLPSDFSINHDHYLYGTPKRQ